mgnify:CR=1 FL=1
MTDPRIPEYVKAASKMKQGKFPVQIPYDEQDEVGILGRELHELGIMLEKKFEEIRKLAEVTTKVNAGLVLDEILNHVFESFRPIIPYNRIGFSLISEDRKKVRAYWAKSDSPLIKLGKDYEAELEGSSLQTIIETGEPRILNDLEQYLREHPDSESTELVVEEGMNSSLTCPLIAMGKPIGFMFFSSFEKDEYKDVHVEIFQQIAGELSVIVEKGRMYQKLLELNDLKNKFLGIAAHDLRNPIGVIRGYLELMNNGLLGEMPDEVKPLLEKLIKTCNTMVNMVNDLLDVSAIESGKLDLRLEKVNVKEYMRDIYEYSHLLAEKKNIDLELEMDPDVSIIILDPERISQILNNLISNAVKYSEPGTRIILRAIKKNQDMYFEVVDQGQGIPEEEIASVFEPFMQTSVKPTAGEKSTGLGLAICKRIAEEHGGKMEVESRVGKGSTFRLILPIKNSKSDS